MAGRSGIFSAGGDRDSTHHQPPTTHDRQQHRCVSCRGQWCQLQKKRRKSSVRQKGSRLTRTEVSYKVVTLLSQGRFYRDEILELGQYRSNPCNHPVRLVSVLWGSTWYTYVTNVLDRHHNLLDSVELSSAQLR